MKRSGAWSVRAYAKPVLIGGYAFYHGKDIFAPLHEVMVERRRDDNVHGFRQRIPREELAFGAPHPSIYCDPRTGEPQARCNLHAKCIVVDEARALVTSANFTDRGQTRNIEMGILIDDPALATRLVHQWRPHRVGTGDQGIGQTAPRREFIDCRLSGAISWHYE